MRKLWWGIGIVVLASVVLIGTILAIPKVGGPVDKSHSFSASRAEQERIWAGANAIVYGFGAYQTNQFNTGNPVRVGLGESAWLWVPFNPQPVCGKIFDYLAQQTGLNFTETQVLVLFNNMALSSYRQGFNKVTGTWYAPGELPTDGPVKRCGVYRERVEKNPIFFDATDFNDAAIANMTNLGVYYLV
jgi:hypothetical protein